MINESREALQMCISTDDTNDRCSRIHHQLSLLSVRHSISIQMSKIKVSISENEDKSKNEDVVSRQREKVRLKTKNLLLSCQMQGTSKIK